MNRNSQPHTAVQPEFAAGPPRNSTRTVQRLARRVGLSLVSVIAIFGLGTTLASSASAAGVGDPAIWNTAQSSNGAFLQSAGQCEGGQFNFTVTATNFEYLEVGVVTAAGVTWTEWAEVPQDVNQTFPLPAGRPGRSYIVVGADYVNGQWETIPVVTSFRFILVGQNYSTFAC